LFLFTIEVFLDAILLRRGGQVAVNTRGRWDAQLTLRSVVGLGNTALGELGDLGSGRDVGEPNTLGEVVAGLELAHLD
jgi:hypothetical protein